MSQPAYARELNLMPCHTCAQICRRDEHRCPRCNGTVHARKHNSIARTWALLLAALILYIPANLLPVMRTNMLGNASDNTIMSGVIEFWKSGSWDIAALIFFASIVVPCMKFLILGLLLVTCQRKSRWAMRDVLVVALVAALVQFRSLSSIDPMLGIVFFGLVVVLTMLAAMSFDPRLIWDAEVEDV